MCSVKSVQLGCAYYEEENVGYSRVSAVFAGAHVMSVFFREAKAVSNDGALGVLRRLRGLETIHSFTSESTEHPSLCASTMFFQCACEGGLTKDRGSKDRLCFTIDSMSVCADFCRHTKLVLSRWTTVRSAPNPELLSATLPEQSELPQDSRSQGFRQ